MKEIRFWAIAALAVLLGVGIWLFDPRIPNSFGSYILLLTLMAVVWYTRETQKLRVLSARQVELSQEQTELSLRPHLEIVFRRAHFLLHNIGYGPATNIRIDPAIVHVSSIPPIRLKFICPPIVRKDEYQPIEIRIFWAKTDGPALDLSPGIYTPPLATETIKITIHYENLMGRPYKRELVIGKEMPIDNEPVDFLLQYLYEVQPKAISPWEIPDLDVAKKDAARALWYCYQKKYAEARGSGYINQEMVLDTLDLRITADGIDYLKRKG